MRKGYKTLAKRRWGKKAVWVTGNGPYALLAPCGVLTVTLWSTLEGAEEAKQQIDLTGCGGRCLRFGHRIVNLETDLM